MSNDKVCFAGFVHDVQSSDATDVSVFALYKYFNNESKLRVPSVTFRSMCCHDNRMSSFMSTAATGGEQQGGGPPNMAGLLQALVSLSHTVITLFSTQCTIQSFLWLYGRDSIVMCVCNSGQQLASMMQQNNPELVAQLQQEFRQQQRPPNADGDNNPGSS